MRPNHASDLRRGDLARRTGLDSGFQTFAQSQHLLCQVFLGTRCKLWTQYADAAPHGFDPLLSLFDALVCLALPPHLTLCLITFRSGHQCFVQTGCTNWVWRVMLRDRDTSPIHISIYRRSADFGYASDKNRRGRAGEFTRFSNQPPIPAFRITRSLDLSRSRHGPETSLYLLWGTLASRQDSSALRQGSAVPRPSPFSVDACRADAFSRIYRL
jgi:hypothetical protein